MRAEIERLFKQAERDLENARKNIGIDAFEVVAFMAQQASARPPSRKSRRQRRSSHG